MRQTLAVHAALKRLLKQHGRTYAQAATVLGLSEPSVKRLFSRGELSLDRMEKLCDWLGAELVDLIELAQAEQPLLTELAPDQERQLLRDPSLLLVAYLLLNRWREQDILGTYRLTRAELTLCTVRLEKLGMVEVMPGGRVKLRTARNFSWRKDGPVQRYFAERVLPEFVATQFQQPGEAMHFVGGMLSRASLRKLHEASAAFAQRFDELVQEDLRLPIAERDGISLFLGIRPWEFSEFGKLRRTTG